MSDVKADAKAIFLQALDCRAPDELHRLLDEACNGDTALRARAEELLRAHQDAGNFLGGPQALGAMQDEPPAERPGALIGPYKLLEQIGEGGMGLVFMAEQAAPVRRTVALKVLKPGMDTRQVVARFEAERQALARMDHPHIAKIHDAGTTPAGRPYFVMELVRGVPITEFSDQHRLGPRRRLELFAQVCRAVQHAHQKGVIHRDLKPSNILVTLHDTVPVPRVIDFGIAKATGERLTERTLVTQFAQMVGTPLYMSPEQAEMNGLDVDTRSDVYALGVLLYELLTGTTPFESETLKHVGFDEMRRLIREEEPPTPSRRLSTLAAERRSTVSERRGVDGRRLGQLLRGELDWVVMRALEKDRTRRYESASALAADVERYLADEPVEAGPPSKAYRLRKFMRRNRRGLIAAGAVAAALAAATVVSTWQAVRATAAVTAERRVRTQSEKVNEILGSIFQDLDPRAEEREGKPLRVLLGERLDRATRDLDWDVVGDPLAVAKLQLTLGRSQLEWGFPEKAVALYTRARATRTDKLGPEHADTLFSTHELALAYEHAGRMDLAIHLLEQTFAAEIVTLGPEHLNTLACMNDLAVAHGRAGRLDREMALLEEALRLKRAALGPTHRATLGTMDSLGVAYGRAGQFDLAVRLLEEVLELATATLGPEYPRTVTAMNNLARAYAGAGKLDKAIPLHQEALRLRKSRLGPEHPDTLASMGDLVEAYGRARQMSDAVRLSWDLVTIQRRRLPGNHPDLATSLALLGQSLTNAQQPADGEPLLRECLAIRESKQPDAWSTFHAKALLGIALLRQNKSAQAEPLLLQGYDGLKLRESKIPPAERECVAEAARELAGLYEATGRADGARTWRGRLPSAPPAGPRP
jgi:serine/threonine protein kinase/tetratricopeptide (TPR) repeat protein